MRSYLIVHNSNYARLAEIAKRSVESVSKYPVVTVDIGRSDESLWWFFMRRTEWLDANMSSFKGDVCLLDADMVATQRLDEIWDYGPVTHFPLFETHGNPGRREHLIKLVPVETDYTYINFVPSLWNSSCSWFIRMCRNIMERDKNCDADASNIITWMCGITRRLPYITVNPIDSMDKTKVLLFHGEKDADKAELVANTI